METIDYNLHSSFTTAILKARISSNPDNLAVNRRGFYISADPHLANKQDIVVTGSDFKTEATGLQKDTKYYFCAYANTSPGITCGDTLIFKTAAFRLEGDYYHTVTIGDQVWMAENLHVKKFQNGENIPYVSTFVEWEALRSAGYCAYFNDEAIADTCGYLYSFYTISDSRGLAPEGWHVPRIDEVAALMEYLGGQGYDATSKIMSRTGWLYLKGEAPGNDTGLTMRPAGIVALTYLFNIWDFYGLGEETLIWTDEDAGFGGVAFGINSEFRFSAGLVYPHNRGLSIRLIKDIQPL